MGPEILNCKRRPIKLQISNDSLFWDGSDLGKFDRSCILESTYGLGGTDNFFKLKLDKIVFWCILQKFREHFPLIVDECQEIFGLPKRKYHLITIEKLLYIAYKVPMEDNKPVWETPIKYIDKADLDEFDISEEMKRIIAVANILTCVRLSDINIRMRKADDGYILVNYYTGTSCLSKNTPYDYFCLSKKNNKWFKNHTIDEYVQSTFNPDGLNLIELMEYYRQKLKNCIYRVDMRYEWIIPYILDRLIRHFN